MLDCGELSVFIVSVASWRRNRGGRFAIACQDRQTRWSLSVKRLFSDHILQLDQTKVQLVRVQLVTRRFTAFKLRLRQYSRSKLRR